LFRIAARRWNWTSNAWPQHDIIALASRFFAVIGNDTVLSPANSSQRVRHRIVGAARLIVCAYPQRATAIATDLAACRRQSPLQGLQARGLGQIKIAIKNLDRGLLGHALSLSGDNEKGCDGKGTKNIASHLGFFLLMEWSV